MTDDERAGYLRQITELRELARILFVLGLTIGIAIGACTVVSSASYQPSSQEKSRG